MKSVKLAVWIIFQFTLFKGGSFLNSTQTDEEVVTLSTKGSTPSISLSSLGIESNTTINKVLPKKYENVFDKTISNSTTDSQAEIIEIFHGNTTGLPYINNTIESDCMNNSSVNLTCIEQTWNDTLKANYSLAAEAIGAAENVPPFRLQKSAAIAAGVFLVSAVIGYLGCVGYRRFLQRKYGNSQVLIGEEVYDTSDLRYFEI